MASTPHDKLNGEQLKGFFDTYGLRLGRCLAPGMKCDGRAIRAHSIQNSRVLDLLAVGGHVVRPKLRVNAQGPSVEFAKVGKNSATTFTGLCADHDATLFRALDAQVFNSKSEEHLFLLAYRSVTREVHTCMEGAIRVQSSYRKLVERGIEDAKRITQASIMATGQLMKAYETYQYRATYFDEPLLATTYDTIQHDVIEFECRPVLAVASLFSFPIIHRHNDLVRCVLNVFPTSRARTVVVFSYAKDDAALARGALAPLFAASGDYQKYELSKLVIERVENFVVSPHQFVAWGFDKSAAIAEAFASTIMDDKPLPDDPILMMF